jgi:hypothetical protein
MVIWGWAMLTTRPRLIEWHKVRLNQQTDQLLRNRFLTACRLTIEANAIPARETPGPGPVCTICRESRD